MTFDSYGHGATVAYGSPKPLIWVRILVPVRSNPGNDIHEGIAGSQIFNLSGMNKISTYFSESYKELVEKVTWPSWTQLQQSTVIVLVATALITVVVFVMDAISKGLLNLVYSLFK